RSRHASPRAPEGRACGTHVPAGPERPPGPPKASLDRLEEAVRSPGPEVEKAAAGRGEHDPVCPADQEIGRQEAHAAHRLREAAVGRVVAVVAHYEVMARRNGEDVRVIAPAVRVDVQHVVLPTLG